MIGTETRLLRFRSVRTVPDKRCHSSNRPVTGPRACLGRKYVIVILLSQHYLTFGVRFNETEGVAALTSIISRYKIEIQDEPQFKHESFEQRRDRILTAQVALTLS